MAKAKHAIPPGWEGALPYLIIDGPGGKVMHAELKVGRALFMLADAFPDMGYHGPKHLS